MGYFSRQAVAMLEDDIVFPPPVHLMAFGSIFVLRINNDFVAISVSDYLSRMVDAPSEDDY